MRFGMENAKVGINLRERPISHYNSIYNSFRTIVDSPSDVQIQTIALRGYRQS
jgi:meso-butanediol dehydrogenase / (S,S)-butanediol dehydrogenase / diacetyl reductase